MTTRPTRLAKTGTGASNETVTLAGCWAHLRRRFYELHLNGSSRLATQTVTTMAELWKIEGDIRGLAPQRAWPPVSIGLPPLWPSCSISGKTELSRISGKSKLAEAIRYATSRRKVLECFLTDGRDRDRFQYRRAGDPASNNHAQERAVRGQRRWRPDMGNHRHPTADSQNERRRSTSRLLKNSAAFANVG
jgi:hypothetical protein